jgi:hypothetical protein
MVSHRKKINFILSASNCLLSFMIFSLYILFLLCPSRLDCYARDTLKHGEWITNDGGTLVSIGGTFELGFFNSIRSSSQSSRKRFVGIWYKQDQQTVVWVANRDNPLNGSIGTFGVAEDGNLKVWDTTGNVYWTTGVENHSSTNRTVKLMDSGNLVISDDNHQLATSLWESFHNLTDTFLPSMKMDESLRLTSWIGDGDPGRGQFTFKKYLQGEGYYVILKKQDDHWRSRISGNFLSSDDQIPFAIAYLLSNFSNTMKHNKYPQLLLDYNYTRLMMNYTDYNRTRLVMKYNGELQYLKWDVDKGIWYLIWKAPGDQCSIYNACGNFGSCNINNRVVCKCLPGFHPTNPENWDSGDFLGGCTRKSTSFDNSDMFLILKMMKVSNPNSNFIVKNETECRKECLNSSQCQAYSYEEPQNSNLRSDSTTTTETDICYIWIGDLSNLQEEYTNGGRNLSVRVAKSVIGTPFTHWNLLRLIL